MVVRAKRQIRINADLASGQVFDRVFENLLQMLAQQASSLGSEDASGLTALYKA